jgi:hypothetical protein
MAERGQVGRPGFSFEELSDLRGEIFSVPFVHKNTIRGCP